MIKKTIVALVALAGVGALATVILKHMAEN